MNISTQEIKRLEAVEERCRDQWSDIHARRRATEAARAEYVRARGEFGYQDDERTSMDRVLELWVSVRAFFESKAVTE